MTTDTLTPIPAGVWRLDPAHSYVEFSVKHLGFATVKGRAREVTGAITGGEQPRIEAVIPVKSLTTFEADRDRHLYTPDFFAADEHPEIRFVGDTFTRLGGPDHAVDGTLTMRGVTRPFRLRLTITSELTDIFGDQRIGFDAEGEVDRRDFGISWNEALPGGNLVAGNVVRLSAGVSAVLED